MGRCSCIRRHCQHRSAADCAALWRQERYEFIALSCWASRRHGPRSRPAPTGKSSTPARISTHSGENRCTMDGSKEQPIRQRSGAPQTKQQSESSGCGPRSEAEPRAQLPPRSLHLRRHFSNNGWLQELPKPMSKLTWDNPVLIGPDGGADGAQDLKIWSGGTQRKKVTGPIWIQAGHPDNSVTVFLGYGRTRAGRSEPAQGFDVYPLRTTALRGLRRCRSRKTGDTYELASTQGYQTMDTPDGGHRPLVRETPRGISERSQTSRKEGRRRAAGTHALQTLSLQ